MSLQHYLQEFSQLRLHVRGGRAKPHKVCMLLAVLDLARAGALQVNRIYYGPQLLERYSFFFNAVAAGSDRPRPYYPFFYLGGALKNKSKSFWHLRALPGRETELEHLGDVVKAADVTNNVAWAELDPELFALLRDPQSVEVLAESLANHWFDRGLQDLWQVAVKAGEISRYEYQLRQPNMVLAKESPAPAYVRDPAFRRVVTEIYDYRCAATGVRILLPTGEAMVEAAHIHPFSEAGDDDPRNGLALTPNIHWAMDKNLIAPGPDMRWHVSSALDDRIPDFHQLTSLAGRQLILPKEPRFYPKGDVLKWRIERLKKQGVVDL